jgi:hypothetical protein
VMDWSCMVELPSSYVDEANAVRRVPPLVPAGRSWGKGAAGSPKMEYGAEVGGSELPAFPPAGGSCAVPNKLVDVPGVFTTPGSAEVAVEADSVAADVEPPKNPVGAGAGAPKSGGAPDGEASRLEGVPVDFVVVFAVVPLSTPPAVDADVEGAASPEQATDAPPVVLVLPEAPAPVELAL